MNPSQIFRRQFNRAPQAVIRAPGRVNLIGEHTDYNDGFVLPCAIDFGTEAAVASNGTQTVRVFAADYGEQDEFPLADAFSGSLKKSEKQWANYIRGVVSAFAGHGFRLPEGVDIAVGGNVPQGAGLSSSAALEVCIGKALQHTFALPADETKIALLGQYAENRFVGCNCGIMDQLASARGEAGHALLIDCRSLETRADVSLEQFEAGKRGLDETAARRAHYIIRENQRTLDAAEAMRRGDITTLSHLMAESHAGMRDEFEITHPAVDLLVDLVHEVIGSKGGVRMTGGGFGGCVVALVPHGLADEVRAHVARHYRAQTGLQEEVFVCRPCAGVAVAA